MIEEHDKPYVTDPGVIPQENFGDGLKNIEKGLEILTGDIVEDIENEKNGTGIITKGGTEIDIDESDDENNEKENKQINDHP